MALRKDAENTDLSRFISKFDSLSKEQKIELILYFVKGLKADYSGKKVSEELPVPAGIFANDVLGSLEAIVKYLKEDLKIKLSRIAKLLNRSSKTIWATYHNASKKMPSPFGPVSHEVVIPASVFADRSFSTLENVVGFIKDLNYSNHEVALMLHLDDRTIWTVYDRVKKKRGMKA